MIPSRSRLRFLLTFVGIAMFATGYAVVRTELFEAALPVFLLGMALHLWSKGILQQNRVLARTGPYRWVRNPFYLANALIDFSLCALIGRVEVAVPFVVLWVLIYRKTILREEGNLRAVFGADFEAYRARVPCIFPWRRPLPRDPAAGFTWSNRNLSQGREVPRLFLIAARPLLFLLAADLHTQGKEYLHVALGWRGLIPCAIVVLWGLATGAEIILRRRKRAMAEANR